MFTSNMESVPCLDSSRCVNALADKSVLVDVYSINIDPEGARAPSLAKYTSLPMQIL